MSCRLASNRSLSQIASTSVVRNGLPPLRPTECHFLQLTDTEAHLLSGEGNFELIEEAVSQCQLLGHPIVYVPERIKELFQEFDSEQSNNPAAQSQHKPIGVQRSRNRSSKSSSGYFIITALDMYSSILIPHWISMPPQELPSVPKFCDLMLFLCKVLGRGPDKYILKFRDRCHQLSFIPMRFPGVEYDDEEEVPLNSPSQCCDPILNNSRVGRLSQPGAEFRSPDVLRVLRLWGLRQTLGWTEMAQEAVSRVCVVADCHAQRAQLEKFLQQ